MIIPRGPSSQGFPTAPVVCAVPSHDVSASLQKRCTSSARYSNSKGCARSSTARRLPCSRDHLSQARSALVFLPLRLGANCNSESGGRRRRAGRGWRRRSCRCPSTWRTPPSGRASRCGTGNWTSTSCPSASGLTNSPVTRQPTLSRLRTQQRHDRTPTKLERPQRLQRQMLWEHDIAATPAARGWIG